MDLYEHRWMHKMGNRKKSFEAGTAGRIGDTRVPLRQDRHLGWRLSGVWGPGLVLPVRSKALHLWRSQQFLQFLERRERQWPADIRYRTRQKGRHEIYPHR